MPSRRSLLGLIGSGLAGSLAGCSALSDGAPNASRDAASTTSPSNESTTTSSDDGSSTTEPDESTQQDQLVVDATRIDPDEVSHGLTLVPLSPRLLDLVSRAATSDKRVDLTPSGGSYDDDPLVIGAFDAIEFQGETYEPATDFAYFAQEATYRYRLEPVNESEVDETITSYRDLPRDEQRVADQILEEGSFDVGHHEDHPDAAWRFREYDALRVDNETYQILVEVGDMATHHMLRLDPTTPDDADRVVEIAVETVPAQIRETVERAVSDGSAAVLERDAMRSFVGDGEYVLTTHAVARLGLHVESPDS